MPIQNTKYLKYAFAQNGEYEYIPDENPADDSVSVSNGYGNKYEMNPEADGLPIKRRAFNGLLNLVTGSVRDFQINGTRLWSSEIAQAQGYPAGARVSVYLDMGTNKLTLAPSKFTFKNKDFYMANTIQLVSLVDENKDDPTIDNNIFKTWWIDDGNDLFHTKIVLATAKGGYYPIPAGYVDVGNNAPNTRYNFDDYPRVKFMQGKQALPDCLIDNGDNTFSIKDLRGGFFRVWSNGSATIDPNRQFDTWQQDAIRDFNITNLGQNGLTGTRSQAAGNYFTSIGVAQDLYGKPSLSNSAIPTTSGVGAENRPYNFNIRMYLKL